MLLHHVVEVGLAGVLVRRFRLDDQHQVLGHVPILSHGRHRTWRTTHQSNGDRRIRQPYPQYWAATAAICSSGNWWCRGRRLSPSFPRNVFCTAMPSRCPRPLDAGDVGLDRAVGGDVPGDDGPIHCPQVRPAPCGIQDVMEPLPHRRVAGVEVGVRPVVLPGVDPPHGVPVPGVVRHFQFLDEGPGGSIRGHRGCRRRGRRRGALDRCRLSRGFVAATAASARQDDHADGHEGRRGHGHGQGHGEPVAIDRHPWRRRGQCRRGRLDGPDPLRQFVERLAVGLLDEVDALDARQLELEAVRELTRLEHDRDDPALVLRGEGQLALDRHRLHRVRREHDDEGDGFADALHDRPPPLVVVGCDEVLGVQPDVDAAASRSAASRRTKAPSLRE